MKVYKVGETINRTITIAMIDAVRSPKYVKYSLKDGEKIYIFPKSDMPRLKFKKNFPNNKIIYDPTQADVFIGGSDLGYYHYISHDMFNAKYEYTTGWIYDENVVLKDKDLGEYNKLSAAYYLVNGDKPLIKDIDILYKGEIPREMNIEEYNTIAKMMGSGEKEMMNLGMEMLLGFDHSINEERYVLILLQVKHSYLLKRSRTFKAILKTLKVKYVNLR